MKKGIIVLLITVLAAGMAFAGVSGSAAVQFKFNLDEGKGYGFGASNSQSLKYTFDFQIDAATVDKAEHETDIWAEIGADAKVSIAKKNASATDSVTPQIDTLEITKANIHINDITVDILGPKYYFQYASSWTTDDDGYPVYDFAGFWNTVNAGGVNILYDGYTLAFAFNNAATNTTKQSYTYADKAEWVSTKASDYKASDYLILATNGDSVYALKKITTYTSKKETEDMVLYIGAETKAYEIAEGATVQAAANFELDRDMKAEESLILAGGAIYAGYEADKLSADIAIDGLLTSYNDESAFGMDVLASVAYDFINGAIYFGTNGLGKDGASYILEAKVGANVPVAEEITLNVSAEMDNLNLAVKEDAFKKAVYKASVGTTVDKLTVAANFGWNVDVRYNAKGKAIAQGLSLGANASYALEVAKITASASVGFIENAKEEKLELYGVKPAISISSDKIVENCTLALGWSGAIFAGEAYEADKTNGSVAASATIKF